MRAVSLLARPLLVLVAALLLVAPAFADDAADRAKLDSLFAALRSATDAQSAQAIDQEIWTVWTSPSDEVVAGRMLEVLAARSTGNMTGTIVLLDKLIEDYPTYAEGWNQRATMHYLMNNYEASLADIEKVLELEPRHFGALSGRVLIYLAQGKRALALRDMAAALEIHPFLNERALFPELQQDMVRI